MRNKIINLILKICLILFIIVLVFSLTVIIKWYINNKKSKNLLYNIKQDTIINENEIDDPNEKSSINIDFSKLLEINKDVIGWIKIEGTTIDYPILQTSNNSYYLTKAIDGSYNQCGWIFMDYTNAKDLTDYNTVIYGHNIKSGIMFADLEKIYKNELKNDTVIQVYTPQNEYIYKIYSVYMGLPDDIGISPNISESQYSEFIKENINKSKYKYNLNVENTAKTITLSTCDKTGTKRIIVHGYLTNNNEQQK